MKIVNYILFLTAIFLIYYCIKNFKILKTKLNFNNIESFTSFNMSDYIPSEWDESPTGFGRNTTGCGSNPNKIWEIREPGDVKKSHDVSNGDLIIIYGSVDCTGKETSDDMTIKLKNKKNITVLGTDNAVFAGGINIGGEANNIIIRNIYFHGLYRDGEKEEDDIYENSKKPEDYIAIRGDSGAANFWIDHCTFTKCVDGLLDMTNGATSITVSWCIFSDPTVSRDRSNDREYSDETSHKKVMLIGSEDWPDGHDNEERDMGAQITIHHCWFSGATRNPRIRYAQPVHLYNNFHDQSGRYDILASRKTNSLSENSYFYKSGRPYKTETGGTLYIIGNILKDTCVDNPSTVHNSVHHAAKLSDCSSSIIAGGGDGNCEDDDNNYDAKLCNFKFEKDSTINNLIDYEYQLDETINVPALVTSKAGAGGNGFPNYTIPSGINSGIVTTGAQDESGGAQDESGANGADCTQNAVCATHGTDRLRDWLGGNADAPKSCQGVNWTAVNHRTYFGNKGANTNDGGYGGLKYTCERTREVSNDGKEQRGCVWNLDESVGDNGDARTIRNWLKNKYGEDEQNLRTNGPCQPANLCPIQEVRGDNVDEDALNIGTTPDDETGANCGTGAAGSGSGAAGSGSDGTGATGSGSGATGGTDESGTTGATGVTNSDNVTVTHNSGSTSQNNSNYWNSECKQQWGAADWKNGCDGIDEDSCKTSGTWAYSNGMPFLCEWKNSKCVNKSSCLIKGSESSGQEGTVNLELRGGLVPIGDGYVDSSPPESLGFGQGHLQPGTRQTLDSARKTAESEYNAYKEHETAFTVAQNAVQNATNKLNKWAAHDNLEKCTPDGNGINYRAIAKAKLEEDFNKPALINEAQTKWNNRANNGINTWFLESDLNKGYLTSAMEELQLSNGNTLKPLTSEVANAIKVHKNEKKRIDDTTFLPLNFPDEDLVCADDIEWKTDGKVWSSRKAYEDAMNDREQKQIDYNEKLTEKQRLKYVWQQAEHDYHDNERKIARKALSTVQLNMVN